MIIIIYVMTVLFIFGIIVFWRQQRQMESRIAAGREALVEAQVMLRACQVSGEEKIRLLENAKERLSLEFKVLATQIFEEKSKNTETQLAAILAPFKEQLKEFEKKAGESYDKETKDRLSLTYEIQHLKKLNQQMSVDSVKLTNALQGQVKSQGCWGEVILERALALSGLKKGAEYDTQVRLISTEGAAFQPDAVIHLPDNREVIVDAKVTLTAYSKYMAAETIEEKELFLKQHLLSIKAHIKNLSDKNYQSLIIGESLDFVLLFMPIEGAFFLAMHSDECLYQEALAKNIIIVTPTTLLATLRTIENMWRFEKHNRHALAIADKAGSLYDKFVGFCQDLLDIGKRLEGTQKSYDLALSKLTQGKGNLISRVEEMKEMGVKANKVLPKQLIDAAEI